MITFLQHLEKNGVEKDIQNLFSELLVSFKEIYEAFTTYTIDYDTTYNTYGEVQLNLDIIADEILYKNLQHSKLVSCFVSEERPTEFCLVPGCDSKKKCDHYFLAFDPVDGSSVAASGLAVGTSVGIYKNVQDIVGMKGRDQIGAVYALYGTHLKIVYTLKNGVHIFSMNEEGEVYLEQENVKIKNSHKICSFGGMQKAQSVPGFCKLILHWAEQKYSLRYSGSMTADCHNVIQKGGGVFTYPAKKLRLLYECNPFALIFEEVGGKAVNLNGENILDIPITSIDQNEPIIIGSKFDVEKALTFLLKHSYA